MKRSLLNKWIARLEDPNTKQGFGVLRQSNDAMCCLGVLCDTYDNTKWTKHSGTSLWYEYDNDSRNHLSERVASELKMDQTGKSKHVSESLVNLNDVHKLSFIDIAKILKARPDYFIESIEEDES